MESGTKKWLTGCGIGCGSMILIAVVLTVIAVRFIRQEFQGVQEAISSHRRLTDKYGEVESFSPRADGSIRPDRMEIFLGIRESLSGPRARLTASLENLQSELPKKEDRSFGTALEILRDLGGLISPIGEYVEQRNNLLLDKDMSLGEYLYIYFMAYYSWLGHSPADGTVVRDRPGRRGREHLFGDDSTFGPGALRRQYREYILRFLENQANQQAPEADAARRSALDKEIERLKESDVEIAWEANLPTAILESFVPYRSRLESSYSESTNCFELPVRNEREWRSWRR